MSQSELFFDNLNAQWALLPDYLSGHLILSLSSVILGLCISIPLAVWATRNPALRGPALAVTSVVQTIPSMALLALMVPLLGGMIGFWPAFAALTLYSVLPVLRNTVTGILEVDQGLKEASLGVGMTDWQLLTRVELPLALPVIVAGIRTATVWVVGTATLSTPVGAESLGNYIFSGLQTRNWTAVVFGCVFAAALAILLDQLIRLIEVSVIARKPVLRRWAGAALALVVGAGLVPALWQGFDRTATATTDLPATAAPGAWETAPAEQPLAGRTVSIGAKAFTEQYILVDVLRRQLEAAGAQVELRSNLGSTILFDALVNNTVDIYVDYTGTIWATIMRRDDVVGRNRMFIEVAHHLQNQYSVLTLGRLGFENAYGFAMRRDRAARLGITTLADLTSRARDLTIGGDPEFFARREWRDVKTAYRLEAARTRSMDSTFMYGAVRNGQVDVISAYTTDGRIAAYDLLLLKDPRQSLPPYDAIVLLAPAVAADPDLAAALMPLLNALPAELMRYANGLVDLEGRLPAAAGKALYDRIGDRRHAETAIRSPFSVSGSKSPE